MKINYQIMDESQKNQHGRYIPDYQKLIEGATCKEEIEYIENIIERETKRIATGNEVLNGFAFNMIYLTRQSCGHFEIFQTPCNEYHTLEKNLQLATEYAEKFKCTCCTCRI